MKRCVCGNSRDWVYCDPYSAPYPYDFKLCAVCARNNKGDQLDVVSRDAVHVGADAVADELASAHLAELGVPLDLAASDRADSDRDSRGLGGLNLGHKTSVTHLSSVSYQVAGVPPGRGRDEHPAPEVSNQDRSRDA